MYQPEQNDAAIYRDIYRDAFGTRPRGAAFEWATEEEFRTDFQRVAEMAEEAMDREETQKYEAEIAFEARLTELVNLGAGDRATAFRWLLTAEDMLDERDMGYVCYCLGLGYSMEAELTALKVEGSR